MLIFILLSVILITPIGFIRAQVPSVPEPVCVPVPGIPCPSETAVAPTPKPFETPSNLAKNFNKAFNDLLKIAGIYASKIINSIEDILDAIKKIF